MSCMLFLSTITGTGYFVYKGMASVSIKACTTCSHVFKSVAFLIRPDVWQAGPWEEAGSRDWLRLLYSSLLEIVHWGVLGGTSPSAESCGSGVRPK